LLDDKTLELNDAGELTVKGGAGGMTASFNSDHFTVSSEEVSLKTPVVTSNGKPSSYNANTLYIIL
jgi:hypothetical protein